MRFSVRALALSAGLAVAAGPAPARAAPLDEAVCKDLDAQQKQLELQGIKDDLAKGPEWGKANLTMARLAVVKQYIEITEEVSFHCPSLVVVSVPELAEPEAKAPLAPPDAKPAAKAAEPPAKVKSKKRKHKAAQSTSGKPAGTATKTD